MSKTTSPKSKKTAKSTDSDEKPVSFEQALTALNAIVERMAQDDLDLDTALTQFEKGVKLSKFCQTQLEQAKLKVNKLNEDLLTDQSTKSPQ